MHDSLANSHLKGKQKKQFETKKIQLLGGKGPKNRSTPYHILSGIKKKAIIREKKQEEKVCCFLKKKEYIHVVYSLIQF
jgi:hypothetical protein